MASLIALIHPRLATRIDEIKMKMSEGYHSAESTRRYLFWTTVTTTALILIPLVGLAIIIPQFINSYRAIVPNIGF